jgi:hypothetical protein
MATNISLGNKMEVHITGWAVFWLFVIVYFFVDTALFVKGYDTLFWRHKTETELQIQQIKVEQMRKEEGK